MWFRGLYVICYANISIFGVRVNVASAKIGNVNILRVKKVGLNNMTIYDFICAFFGVVTGEFIYDIIKSKFNSHDF